MVIVADTTPAPSTPPQPAHGPKKAHGQRKYSKEDQDFIMDIHKEVVGDSTQSISKGEGFLQSLLQKASESGRMTFLLKLTPEDAINQLRIKIGNMNNQLKKQYDKQGCGMKRQRKERKKKQ